MRSDIFVAQETVSLIFKFYRVILHAKRKEKKKI